MEVARVVEIASILEKLDGKDREKVEKYIEELRMKANEAERLRRNLEISADILQCVLENINVIQTAVNNILRAMRPVLKVREVRFNAGRPSGRD